MGTIHVEGIHGHGQRRAIKSCSCKKNKCLKLYCVCFTTGALCSTECLCSDCYNGELHELTDEAVAMMKRARLEAVQIARQKNPNAFMSEPKRKIFAKRTCPGCSELISIASRTCICGQEFLREGRTDKLAKEVAVRRAASTTAATAEEKQAALPGDERGESDGESSCVVMHPPPAAHQVVRLHPVKWWPSCGGGGVGGIGVRVRASPGTTVLAVNSANAQETSEQVCAQVKKAGEESCRSVVYKAQALPLADADSGGPGSALDSTPFSVVLAHVPGARTHAPSEGLDAAGCLLRMCRIVPLIGTDAAAAAAADSAHRQRQSDGLRAGWAEGVWCQS